MVKRFILFLGIIFLPVFSSCISDEEFPPKSIDFEFLIAKGGSKGNGGSFFTFDKGKVLIKSIEFEGIKENGSNYYFESEFDSVVTADLASGTTNPNISFDVPQGIYNRIKLNIKVAEKDSQPGLIIGGNYKFPPLGNGPPDNIPPSNNFKVKTIIDFGFSVSLNAKADRPNPNEIVFNNNQPQKMEIRFDPDFWFRAVSRNLINRAEIKEEDGGEKVLEISKTKNGPIFDVIFKRIEQSTEAVLIY